MVRGGALEVAIPLISQLLKRCEEISEEETEVDTRTVRAFWWRGSDELIASTPTASIEPVMQARDALMAVSNRSEKLSEFENCF